MKQKLDIYIGQKLIHRQKDPRECISRCVHGRVRFPMTLVSLNPLVEYYSAYLLIVTKEAQEQCALLLDRRPKSMN